MYSTEEDAFAAGVCFKCMGQVGYVMGGLNEGPGRGVYGEPCLDREVRLGDMGYVRL